MCELLLLLGVAARANPTVVVTFDNGEFNAPLYTPRWNGRWSKPSAAQEIAASIARVAGANPEIHTYLPPGQGQAGPGGQYLVRPARAGCSGAAEKPGDPCWCAPADNCWSDLQPNWYPGASTSLYLTAQNLRSGAPSGPRLEVHVTDLFEEDPTSAQNPADSDRCVTLDGVRRAVAALVTPPEGEHLDHLAVGLLRASIDPPPPGASWGNTYAFVKEDERCHSGRKTGPWEAGVPPLTLTMAVVVLGIGTAGDQAAVSAFLDGLVGQLDAGDFEFSLLRVAEPPSSRVAERLASVRDLGALHLEPLGPLPTVPCGAVSGEATLTSGGRPVPVTGLTARCDGSIDLAVDPAAVRRAFLDQAGASPRWTTTELTGEIRLTADLSAFDQRLQELRALDQSERPLPLWPALEDKVVELARAAPWTTTVAVRSVRVSDVDSRPWLLVVAGSTIVALLAGTGSAAAATRMHAARSLRRHWAISLAGGRDPLLQRPIAAVLGAAQEEVARAWPLRVLVGVTAGLVAGAGTALAILLAYRVLLG